MNPEDEEPSILLDAGDDDTLTVAPSTTTFMNLSRPDAGGPRLIDGPDGGDVSPLEQDVLDEYVRLLGNMDKLSTILTSLTSGPITLEVADGLRLLERKVTSVYTLMKASVYSIVLQQGQFDGEE